MYIFFLFIILIFSNIHYCLEHLKWKNLVKPKIHNTICIVGCNWRIIP